MIISRRIIGSLLGVLALVGVALTLSPKEARAVRSDLYPPLFGGSPTIAKQLPSGATGVWVGSQNVVTSPRTIIKNEITNGATDQNILAAPRRLFADTYPTYWSPFGSPTITDKNATAPDGSNDATTLVSAGSTNWGVFYPTTTVPNGNYTACLTAKWTSTGTGQFKLGDAISAVYDTDTATSSYQRFCKTITVASGSVEPIFKTPDGVQAANFAIIDFQMFAGSADLNPSPLSAPPASVANGDIVVGMSAYDTNSGVSGGKFKANGFGTLQFKQPIGTSAWTIAYVVNWTAAPHDPGWTPVLATMPWQTLSFGVGINGNVGVFNSAGGKQQTYNGNAQLSNGLFGSLNKGPEIVVERFDGSTYSDFLNGVKLLSHSGTGTAPSVEDFNVGFLQKIYTAGQDIYVIAYWGRAISDSEVSQTNNVMRKLVSPPSPRNILFEGTSITFGANGTSYAYLFGPTANPITFGADFGTSGKTIGQMISAESTVLATLSGVGGTKIVSIEAGANDLGVGNTYSGNPNGFTTQLASYLDTAHASGFKTLCHTIMARLDQADGGTQFLADRATANTTISGWVGTHCDALADWASDPTMGTDTAPNNTTYFVSKVHPTTAGYQILVTYDTPAINGL